MCRLAAISCVNAAPIRSQTALMNSMRGLLSAGTGNTFSCLTALKALAHCEVASTPHRAIIHKDDARPWDIEIEGSRVTATDVRTVYAKVKQRCKMLLKELLLGMAIPRLDPIDNMSDERSGAGMRASRDAGIDQEVHEALLGHVLDTPERYAEFIAGGEGGRIDYHGTRAEVYLRLYDDFIQNYLVLVHIGGGMPARATELSSLTRINGNSALRGLYLILDSVFTMSCYNKTRAMKGLNTPIARFLDKEASRIALIDNLVIRPFVQSLANHLGLNENGVYRTDLFVIQGEGVTAEKARVIFTRLYAQYSGRHLSFGQYRHVVKYFANQLGIAASLYPDSSDSDDPRDDHDMDRVGGEMTQFGHTRAVGDQTYAVTAGEHSRIRDHHVSTFKGMSKMWHTFLADQTRPHPARVGGGRRRRLDGLGEVGGADDLEGT